MAKIVQMSEALTNMIAAGEVVERPSNVVKELVENSLDAGATRINISVLEGGIRRIEVNDNGCGMEKSDVLMSFMPHATSKIKNEYDLFRVRTLGFRGEAIPSIAAVSKMTITSKDQESSIGYKVGYRYGKKQSAEEVVVQEGTTIVVEELFYNTPVRLKYLKSPERELASISYLIDRLALTNPNVAFSLENDGKSIFKTTGNGDMVSLFGAIYGLNVAKLLCEETFSFPGYSGRIYFAKPEVYRSNKLQVTLIINGRYIKNNNLIEALISAFDGFLPINKYPILALYLDIDPLLIDVNIHPKKAEVKIADVENIARNIKETLRKALENTRQIPEVSYKNDINLDELESWNYEPLRPSINSKHTLLTDVKEEYLESQSTATTNNVEPIEYRESRVTITKKEESIVNVSYAKLPELFFVGIAHKTYIILENDEGIYILDQHAAAERIRYEENIKKMSDPSQPQIALLVPLSICLTSEESIFLETKLDEFLKMGFNLEGFGLNTFVVREVPVWAKDSNLEEIITSMISDMMSTGNTDIRLYRDKIAKIISCRASIKAHDKITRDEAMHLVRELGKCDNPYHCPHGRPTLIKITLKELEKMFERIQN